MRRSLILTFVLAIAAAAVAVATTDPGSGGPEAQRDAGPATFSASVSGSSGSSDSVAVTPDADPTTWGQARDREFGRRSRRQLARRLTRMVLASSAQRLGVREDVLTDAVRKAAAAHRRAARRTGGLSQAERDALRACRRYRNACDREAARAAYLELRAAWPGQDDLTGLRDDLTASVARALGRPRADVLRAFRDELEDRVRQGSELGIITRAAGRRALDCFDAPAACDVDELKRELRAGRLLG